MKRSLASVIIGAIFAGAITGLVAATGSAATPFSFAVIGDIPYGSSQLSMFPQRVEQLNADPQVQLVTHLGDIGGPPNCSDSYYATIKSAFDGFEDPLLYTPGDNEWADCSNAAIGAADPLNRLAALRRVFFPQPGQSLGQNPAAVLAQPGYPENVMLDQAGITFGVVHIVGSENDLAWWKGNRAVTPEQKAEVDARNIADIALIHSTFSTAKTNNSRAVVLMTQADMFTGSPNRTAFGPLVKALASEASAYNKPVFLFNGDTHSFASDKPLTSSTWLSYYGISTAVPNLSRFTIQGGPNVAQWLKVTVVSSASVLQVEQVPFGNPVLPVASFTTTSNALSASYNASGSTGAGGVAEYSWTFGDGSSGTGVSPSHTYAAAGTYSVTLTVTDSHGATASKTGSVTVAAVASGPGEDTVVVPAKSAWSWRFDSKAPDAAWKNPGYDASGWKSGAGVLGYGSAGLGTNIDVSGTPGTRPLAGYFIRKFAVDNASAVTKLSLRTVADDGVVVFVNGTEVGRSNMPAGPVTFNTYASSTTNTATAAANPVVIDVPVSLLVTGTNTIAAEIHLNYHGTANVSFDLTATATTSGGGGGPVTNKSPVAKFTSSVSGLAASVDGSASSDPDGSLASYAWDYGDQTKGTGTTAAHTYAAAGTYSVTLTVTDNQGATGVMSAPVTVAAPTGPVDVVVVPTKAAWSWRFAPTAPDAAWKNRGYDASSWNVGSGTLGFGAAGLGTNIDVSGPVSTRPLAAYFIGQFNVATASKVSKLSLKTIADDGVVVYVNGTEVIRSGMPTGPITFRTYATTGFRTAKAAASPVTVNVPLSLLVDGVNTIAVETHLNYHATPDLSFDLGAVATVN
ncbi:PKD domain-containing protein [Paeniglutamicibacter antarcticus]|uniref:PKD domain-containing protein n=1 Tax=Arthrobacter terrae TaxID=2935737 RepID=A0A931CIX4_9MICC|nr:PKD domain-containing protein [Arthrobacter terrae]MBG0737867.1 PKD domain-containing protein [Arthrobacter terrae]